MSGTGTDPSTERCPDCGHLYEAECGCTCCGIGKIVHHISRCAVCWPVFAALGKVFDGLQ